MIFDNPRMLWLMAVAMPLLIAGFWWSWRKRHQLTKQFVQTRLLAQLTLGVSQRAQKARMVLLLAAVASLFLALARPMWGETTEEVRQRGLDIIVAIDTSRSMLAADVAPNRLARAKLAALDLMNLAKFDRLGLIAFAGTAFLQCPLTLDDQAFRQSINALQVGIIPQGGTAIAEAIDTARSAFKNDADNFKVLVLFTDGENHEAGALEAAEKAAQDGMRVFTVGVGTANGEVMQWRDEQGRSDYVKDAQGNVVKSRLDEALLTQIATATDGFYLGLSGTDAMDVLYRRGLEPLPRTETATRMIRQHKHRFMWPLSLAISLLLIEIFVPDRKRVQKAVTAPLAPASEDLRKAVAILLIGLVSFPAFASSRGALRQYQEGRFAEAHEEFERLSEQRPDDPRLRYNAGAAAYQAKKYEEAAQHFQSALDPENLELQQQAYYNLGNAHFRLGEKEADPQQKAGTWEQATKDYEFALKLNPEDEDAKYNLELVKKLLEKLRQEQEKDDQKQRNQDESQDENDQEQKDSESKEDQRESSQSKDNQEQKDDSKQPEQPDQQTAQNQEKGDQGQKEEEQTSGGGERSDQDQSEQASAAGAPGQMTREEVEKLLDALRAEEKAMIFQPPQESRHRDRIFKDW